MYIAIDMFQKPFPTSGQPYKISTYCYFSFTDGFSGGPKRINDFH